MHLTKHRYPKIDTSTRKKLQIYQYSERFFNIDLSNKIKQTKNQSEFRRVELFNKLNQNDICKTYTRELGSTHYF